MKTLIAGILLVVATSVPSSSQTTDHAVRIKRVLQHYDNHTQIRPVLVNESTRSIYLDPYGPGFASVYRFYLATREWTGWGGLGECRVGEEKHLVEIKPGEEYEIFVNWGVMLVDSPPPGRYKLRVRYSAESWAVRYSPEKIDLAESTEFFLAGAGANPLESESK